MTRVGVGIVTYERFDRFKECFDNLLKHSEHVDEVLIVDDGSTEDRKLYDDFFDTLLLPKFKVIVHKKNSGVGVAKNSVLKYFYDKGFEYIFTLENDINVLDSEVFNKYIECSIKTGFQYINFALHGPLNVGQRDRRVINDYEVDIYPQLTGALSLHTRKLIDKIGFYDEEYHNAYEHVDYYYMAAKKKLTAPFWMFIDIKDSDKYLAEQYGSIYDSTIRSNTSWIKATEIGLERFNAKHGVNVIDIPHL